MKGYDKWIIYELNKATSTHSHSPHFINILDSNHQMTNISGSLSRNLADKSRERLLFRKGYPELGYFSESSSIIDNDEPSVHDGFKKCLASVRWHVVNAYKMGRTDPRKFKFGVKSGLAFAIVSALTYITEPVQMISENIIWAILTVILIFEFNVGKQLFTSSSYLVHRFFLFFFRL